MVECNRCGRELKFKAGFYVCPFCKSEYPVREYNNFIIEQNNEIKKYIDLIDNIDFLKDDDKLENIEKAINELSKKIEEQKNDGSDIESLKELLNNFIEKAPISKVDEEKLNSISFEKMVDSINCVDDCCLPAVYLRRSIEKSLENKFGLRTSERGDFVITNDELVTYDGKYYEEVYDKRRGTKVPRYFMYNAIQKAKNAVRIGKGSEDTTCPVFLRFIKCKLSQNDAQTAEKYWGECNYFIHCFNLCRIKAEEIYRKKDAKEYFKGIYEFFKNKGIIA